MALIGIALLCGLLCSFAAGLGFSRRNLSLRQKWFVGLSYLFGSAGYGFFAFKLLGPEPIVLCLAVSVFIGPLMVSFGAFFSSFFW
jgi:dipeptide/tripeptide permease